MSRISLISKTGMEVAIITAVDSILSEARSRQKQIVALIREMVECESPSDDPAAVNRFVDLLGDVAPSFARVKTVPGGRFGRHVVCEFELFGRKKAGQILALGHSDTVWPLGTLASMPFRQKDGRLWGPGVLDMKAGIAFFIYAMRILRDLEMPVAHKVVMQINSDEEVGSESSRALTEKNAKRSEAVLVLEPGTGLEGKLKTARKGIGGYTVTVRGKADAFRPRFRWGRQRHSGVGAADRKDRRIHRFAPRHHGESRRDFGRHARECSGGGSQGRGGYARSAAEGRRRARSQVPRPAACG